VRRKRSINIGLSFRVLRAFPRGFQTVLFALFFACVAGKQTGFAQGLLGAFVGLEQGSGSGVDDGSGLATRTPADDFSEHIHTAQAVGQAQGQRDGGLVRGAWEALLEGCAIDDDVAIAWLKEDARDGALSAADGGIAGAAG
jgi:hypothetical protein